MKASKAEPLMTLMDADEDANRNHGLQVYQSAFIRAHLRFRFRVSPCVVALP